MKEGFRVGREWYEQEDVQTMMCKAITYCIKEKSDPVLKY